MKLFLVMATALLAIGCTGTKAAYKAAESPDEYAFVVASHYDALVNEAADLAEQPGTPERVKAALKAADARAKPLVLKLRGLAENYQAVKSAETQKALQDALNQAVFAVADFIRALKAGQVTGNVMPELAGGLI